MVRFQILGPVVAYGERGPISLGPARQRTVLAALMIEPGATVSVEQLVERVWGDAQPRRVRGTMHAYLSRLRTTLADAGGPPLLRRSHSYLLDVAPEAVDLYRFRALVRQARQTADAAAWQEGLALWRGTPLADLDSDWARDVATALQAERLGAVLDRNDLLLRNGEHTQLLAELAADAAAHPFDERLAAQLMVALYRSGRPADALAHYRSLSRQLADKLGSDPGQALQQLHQQMLRQDPQLAAAADRLATSLPATGGRTLGPPAQLPADNAGFTGRAEPLRQLEALSGAAGTAAPTVVITAIGGTGGIGKTALAVHWAHRARDRFPDGQLYLNLRGFVPGGHPMGVGEALRNLLELLDVPAAQIPTSVESQAARYRSRLAGTRTLVVLDNARDAAQVRPLIPGSPGCMVVVTSRNQLTGLATAEGAHLIRLDTLTDEEARQLLTNRLGAQRIATQPDAVADVIAACAGLPLALAIVAARAATRPTFPLSTFAAELTDTRNRLEALTGPDITTDVRAVFSWSYDTLTAPAARTFRLLGLHPGPDIGLPAAASLIGLPPADARRLLNELADAHLITEHSPHRYAFHDLLRAYASDQTNTIDTSADRHAARHRMLDYYLHATCGVGRSMPRKPAAITLDPPMDGVVAETFADSDAAEGWLTAEQPVLQAIFAMEDFHTGFDQHIQLLAEATNNFLVRLGRWRDKVTAQLAGLSAAQRRGDQAAQAAMHRGLAHAYERLEQRDEALSHIHEARKLFEAIGDHTGQARTLIALVWLSERQGRYRDGLGYAQQCLDVARAGGDRLMQAWARHAVGWCHSLLGDHELAITHCGQALAEMREIGDPVGIPDALNGLGSAHRRLGHHQQAADFYRQAADWTHTYGTRWDEAETLVRLGDTHHEAADDDAARTAWQRALEIFDEIDHPDADELRDRLASLS